METGLVTGAMARRLRGLGVCSAGLWNRCFLVRLASGLVRIPEVLFLLVHDFATTLDPFIRLLAGPLSAVLDVISALLRGGANGFPRFIP